MTINRVPQQRPLRPTIKALPEDTRRHNRSLVLQSLFRGGPMSRADLARLTGLTRVTTSDLVAELMAADLLVDLGTRTESRVGKPATLVGIRPDATTIVSLDLSDSQQLRGALVDLAGTITEHRSIRVGRPHRRRGARAGPRPRQRARGRRRPAGARSRGGQPRHHQPARCRGRGTEPRLVRPRPGRRAGCGARRRRARGQRRERICAGRAYVRRLDRPRSARDHGGPGCRRRPAARRQPAAR